MRTEDVIIDSENIYQFLYSETDEEREQLAAICNKAIDMVNNKFQDPWNASARAYLDKDNYIRVLVRNEDTGRTFAVYPYVGAKLDPIYEDEKLGLLSDEKSQDS